MTGGVGMDSGKRYAISEAAGCVVVYLIAAGLHSVYELSGGTLAIIFGAVNESVWEHVKIFSAGYAGYAILQLMWIRVPFRRYLVAKCAGLYLLMGGIIGFFYLYTSLAGEAVLWVDLISSAALVCVAQGVSYLLTTRVAMRDEWFYPALLLLMLYYLMFFSFTIFPPRAELFRDPQTGLFGIGER
jgi:hypothetical protein